MNGKRSGWESRAGKRRERKTWSVCGINEKMLIKCNKIFKKVNLNVNCIGFIAV